MPSCPPAAPSLSPNSPLSTLRSSRTRRSPVRMPEKIFPRRHATGERNLATGFLHLFPAASSFISRPPTGRLTPAATLSLSDLRVRLVFDREILRRFILFLYLAAHYPFADPRLYTCQNATRTILRYSRKVFFFFGKRVSNQNSNSNLYISDPTDRTCVHMRETSPLNDKILAIPGTTLAVRPCSRVARHSPREILRLENYTTVGTSDYP